MENNDILVRFHTMNYEERLHAALQQKSLAEREAATDIERENNALGKAAEVALQAICRIEPLQRTAICQERDL